jgi:hypothetical protein
LINLFSFKEAVKGKKYTLENLTSFQKLSRNNKWINSCGTSRTGCFSFGAGNIGEHPLRALNFDEGGKVVSLPIRDQYVVVARPNQPYQRIK